jgi:hypothetical protein
MPFVGRLYGISAAFAVLSLAIWVGRFTRWSDTGSREAAAQAAAKELAERRRLWAEEELRESKKPQAVSVSLMPAIAKQPPFPKALVEGAEADFGTVLVGEKRKHFVRIKNVGDAPLILYRPPVGCRGGDRGWRRELQVGEACAYEMSWTAKEPALQFELTHALFTNDPQRPKIEMRVYGKVRGPLPRLMLEERVYDFGRARVGQPLRHVFHFKNVGDAPLEICPAPVCGKEIPLTGIGWRRLIQPGETFDLGMTCIGREATLHFAQRATFVTNDPANPEVSVKVCGTIWDPKWLERAW